MNFLLFSILFCTGNILFAQEDSEESQATKYPETDKNKEYYDAIDAWERGMYGYDK